MNCLLIPYGGGHGAYTYIYNAPYITVPILVSMIGAVHQPISPQATTAILLRLTIIALLLSFGGEKKPTVVSYDEVAISHIVCTNLAGHDHTALRGFEKA